MVPFATYRLERHSFSLNCIALKAAESIHQQLQIQGTDLQQERCFRISPEG